MPGSPRSSTGRPTLMTTDQELPPLNRRLFSRFVPLGLVAALAGCDYSPPAEDQMVSTGIFVDPSAAGRGDRPGTPGRVLSEEEVRQKKDILDGALKLIQSSATTSGGNPFQQATKNLNQYFDSTSPGRVRPRPGGPRVPAPADARAGREGARGAGVHDPRCAAPGRLHAVFEHRVAGRRHGRRPDAGRPGVRLDGPPGPAHPPRVARPRRPWARCTPAPSTSSCAGWRPSRKGAGPSGAGCSCPSAASWGSTSAWSRTRPGTRRSPSSGRARP